MRYRDMEDDWQARDDAHTLARAAEIKKDPDRLSKATSILDTIAQEALDQKDQIVKDVYPSMEGMVN